MKNIKMEKIMIIVQVVHSHNYQQIIYYVIIV